MTADYSYLLSRMEKYCAYQERCVFEVEHKLGQWKAQPQVIEKIINELINNGFIDEERFARVYAGSKFRLKKWGKNRIYRELKMRKIPDIYIEMGLNEIDDEEYIGMIRQLITKKDALLKDDNPIRREQKIAAFVIGKGYKPGLVWSVLKETYN